VSGGFPALQLISSSQMTEQSVADNRQKSVCCADPEIRQGAEFSVKQNYTLSRKNSTLNSTRIKLV